MGYTVRADVEAEIAAKRLTQLLDPDNTGTEQAGLFAALAAATDTEINGALTSAMIVPVPGEQPALRQIARILTCDLLHRRSMLGADANPYQKRADDVRARLADIAAGKIPLIAAGGLAGSFGYPSPEEEEHHDGPCHLDRDC